MKVAALAAALCAVLFVSHAEARPRHVAHHRYAPECNVSMPCEGVGNLQGKLAGSVSAKESRRLARGQELYDAMPFGMPTDRAGNAVSPWAARWTARPRAWCGWWLARQKGIRDARLNLARNWAHLYGSPSRPQPGAVVVWPHHVGELVSHVSGNVWIVRSGNDGNAVRERPRSIAGAIAFRA
ncbi:hypothetical protein BN961_01409 [Afipia felis]|uniref:Peptidase C51 domain-containing protein n=1 Tax=Afipia felis TaxID=1035 RepID=A0A090MKQ0_AFIFE|nr:hypothetical protein [Afipia felis]CEG08001.1 hypothetical protein BN961_01409 [Afipia felis]